MKVYMGKTTLGIVLSLEEAKSVIALGQPAWFTAQFEWRGKTLVINHIAEKGSRRGSGRGVSSLWTPKEHPEERRMQWLRSSIEGADRWPVFGACYPESHSFFPGGLRIVLPPEEKRPPVSRRKFKPKNYAVGVLPSSAVAAEILKQATNGGPKGASTGDLLDALRHHRDKLNALQKRHPENITFKIKPDGSLALEILLDE